MKDNLSIITAETPVQVYHSRDENPVNEPTLAHLMLIPTFIPCSVDSHLRHRHSILVLSQDFIAAGIGRDVRVLPADGPFERYLNHGATGELHTVSISRYRNSDSGEGVNGYSGGFFPCKSMEPRLLGIVKFHLTRRGSTYSILFGCCCLVVRTFRNVVRG